MAINRAQLLAHLQATPNWLSTIQVFTEAGPRVSLNESLVVRGRSTSRVGLPGFRSLCQDQLLVEVARQHPHGPHPIRFFCHPDQVHAVLARLVAEQLPLTTSEWLLHRPTPATT